tara:strand:- start:399 stop:695 length:297 start_codon:yes stop_codon:yes gene_type:complete
MKLKKMPKATLTLTEKWCNSYLVTYPVSYTYNGGIIVDGKLYAGFEVPNPKVPKGFELESIYCGLQLNAKPPYATSLLKPIDGKKRTKTELKKLIANP